MYLLQYFAYPHTACHYVQTLQSLCRLEELVYANCFQCVRLTTPDQLEQVAQLASAQSSDSIWLHAPAGGYRCYQGDDDFLSLATVIPSSLSTRLSTTPG